MTRVAVAQCAIGTDKAINLATCLRMLDKAAECSPDFVVLPEFSNYLSWYDDADHCYAVAEELDGEFLTAIAAKAKEIGAHVAVGATLKRENKTCSGSSLLYSPEGELLGIADKQVLIGHENDFLTPAKENAPIIETEYGRVGLYMCMDGVINETPRGLALRGAQLLLNSLNSFAPDEGNLHIPVRAPENRVFIAAANKTGLLVPEFMAEGISEATNIPVDFLKGAGESQVVAPDGTVLAMATSKDEEVVFADIDLSEADSKLRPDGSDIFANRRPELYRSLADNPETQPLPDFKGAESVLSAVISVQGNAALTAVKTAVEEGAKLICLPRLAAKGTDQNEFIDTLAALLPEGGFCAMSMLSGSDHQAILIGSTGIVHRQGQLHASASSAGSALADSVDIFESPYGKLALVCGDDSIYPETFRLLAMQGAEVALVPFQAQEAWETETGLVERAAENRVNMLAASTHNGKGESFIAALHEDFTIFTEWKTRQFDGVLTRPMLSVCETGSPLILAEIHPKNAENKVVSRNTHLINNRPWWLMSAQYGG